jgi:hypothetical protein
LSLKTRVQATTVALVLAAAGIYYLRNTVDTSGDRQIDMSVTVKASKSNAGVVSVDINLAESLTEPLATPQWNHHMWIRPGEVVTLAAMFPGVGKITCTITDRGNAITNSSPVGGWQENHCSVSVTG